MTQLAGHTTDTDSPEAFAERLMGILNDAGLALMLAIGHRTGLFDALAGMMPATTHQIAARAGLNERYIREWLGAMVTGRIIHYNAGDKTYHLPPVHAGFLTRAGSPNNLAASMQWISVLASVEDGIVERFSAGGGVHYHDYHRFHEVMAAESEQTVVAALLDHILPLEPGLIEQLRGGIDALDIGCGSGRALCLMARTFPASRFTGYDLCDDAVQAARSHATSLGLSNARFEAHDLARMEVREAYDLITAFDVIHDQRDPAAVLRCVYAALKPAGLFLMQDLGLSSHLQNNMDHPLAPFIYTISTMHCMSVSLAQNGAGLGAAWGEELAVRMLGEAGFKKIAVRKLPHDIQNNFYLVRKG